MKTYSFESLDVWQKSRELVNKIYLLSGDFPIEERYSLTQQLRRASLSITCNLAEGNSRKSGKEQARYTEVAYGSLLEVLNLLILATDLQFIAEEKQSDFRLLITEIGNKLNKLRSTQLNK
jgi:four helix bundle protein